MRSLLEREREIRRLEAEAVAGRLPSQGRVLELGAGAGWQARFFAERGLEVDALDVASGRFAGAMAYPVGLYDGEHIPFPDGSFDAVFTSNVLEHVVEVESLLRETRRVLRTDGRALHVLPTPSWRFWTTLLHYPGLVPQVLDRLARRRSGATSSGPPGSRRSMVRRVLAPSRHGEVGNFLSELYLYSRFRWRSLFRRAGFEVVERLPLRLFYTPYGLSGRPLSTAARRRLSFLLGSSTSLYVLRPESGGARG